MSIRNVILVPAVGTSLPSGCIICGCASSGLTVAQMSNAVRISAAQTFGDTQDSFNWLIQRQQAALNELQCATSFNPILYGVSTGSNWLPPLLDTHSRYRCHNLC